MLFLGSKDRFDQLIIRHSRIDPLDIYPQHPLGREGEDDDAVRVRKIEFNMRGQRKGDVRFSIRPLRKLD